MSTGRRHELVEGKMYRLRISPDGRKLPDGWEAVFEGRYIGSRVRVFLHEWADSQRPETFSAYCDLDFAIPCDCPSKGKEVCDGGEHVFSAPLPGELIDPTHELIEPVDGSWEETNL